MDTTKGDRAHELNEVHEWVLMQEPSLSTMWIESAIMGKVSGVQTAVKLAATQGAVLSAHEGPAFIVAPATWKAGTVGNGHASKEEVAWWLAEEFSDLAMVCANQDEVDAMCLSLYGKMLTDGEIEPPKPKPKKRKKKPDG